MSLYNRWRSGFARLAGLLVFSLVFGLVAPASRVAYGAGPELPPSAIRNRQRAQIPDRAAEKTELVGWRTRNAQHFLNSDGSFTAEIFRESRFYEDPITHALLAVDNTTKPADKAGWTYMNTANRFKAYFGQTAESVPSARLEFDDSYVEFTPVGARPGAAVASGNTISYPGAYPGAALKYEVRSDEIKESITLAIANAPTTFSFALTLVNLTYTEEADGSIALHKPGQNGALMVIPKPFMFEEGNEANASLAVSQAVRQEGAQLYLDIRADTGWLSQPGRQFPVVIDPTIVVQPDTLGSRDSFAASNIPSGAHYTLTSLFAGSHATYGTTRSYLWFSLPTIPSGARIMEAKFSLYMYQSYGSGTTIQLRRVNSNWTSSTLTWNNQPNFATSAESSLSMSTAGWQEFSATSLVQDWYNGDQGNYGVMLMASPESAAARAFYSGDHSTPGTRPMMTITYELDPVGDQSFWTYAGSVNPFNGNLMVQAVDLATPGRGPQLPIARAYNSRATDRAGDFGYGWRSNLDMFIRNVANGPLRFWDASGTKHVFANRGDGTYAPPPGIHFGLRWLTTENRYEVRTLSDLVLTFDGNGRLIAATDKSPQATGNQQSVIITRDASGHITSIQDASGRTMTVDYGTHGFIQKITDPAGRYAEYSYFAGNLIGVTIRTATDPGINTAYSYKAGTSLLEKVTDPNLNDVTVSYDTNGRVASTGWSVTGTAHNTTHTYNASPRTGTITGPLTGQTTIYTFNDNANLLRVDVSADTNTTITTQYTWDASNHLLSVTDPGGRTVQLDYNDKGQPVLVTDPNGLTATVNYDQRNNWISSKNASGDVSASAYDNDSRPTDQIDPLGNSSLLSFDPATGNLLAATMPVSLANNLISNPGFEDALLHWTSTAGAIADTTNRSGGLQSLRLTAGNTIQTGRDMPVTPGSIYTLTTDIMTDASARAYLRVRWYKALGVPSTAKAMDDTLSVTKSNPNWQRKGAHVVAPSDAVFARVELVAADTGQVWFDNTQFETGAGRWGNNTLVNPGFDYDREQAGIPDYWDPYIPLPGNNVVIDYQELKTGSASLRLKGVSGTDVFAGQQVDLSGEAGTLLAFSGWAKSIGASTSVGSIKMQVYLKDSSGVTTEVFEVSFDPNQDWHKKAAIVKATAPFAFVKVYADFDNQTGTVWFDNFEVAKFSPTSAAVSEFNYMENGSFEVKDDNLFWPEGWMRAGPATFTWESLTDAYTGEHAVSIQNTNGYSASITSERWIPYEPQKSYTAVAYGLAEGISSSAELVIRTYDANDGFLQQIPADRTLTGDTGWVSLLAVLDSTNVHPNTARIRVAVQMYQGTGIAYFDNVRLLMGDKRTISTYGDSGQNYVTAVEDPLKNRVTLDVNPNTGFTTAITGPRLYNGNPVTTTFTADFLNRLTATTYEFGGIDRTFTYSYDDNGNITQVTDPNGVASWKYTYTELNEPRTAVERVGGADVTSWFDYNGDGTLLRFRNPANNFDLYSYDSAGRVLWYSYGTGSTVEHFYGYQYWPNGNLKQFSEDGGGNNTSLTYNSLNLVEDVTDANGSKVHSDYDTLGRRTGITVTGPGPTTWSVGIEYDDRGLVRQITDNTFSKNAWYLYNEGGQRFKAFYEDGSSAHWAYDGAARVKEILVHGSDGVPTTRLAYEYDPNSNVTKVSDLLNGKSVEYKYDELDQLAEEKYLTGTTVTKTITYVYDELGNRTAATTVAGSTTTVTYGYNSEKNRLTRINSSTDNVFYDLAGNMISDGTSSYTWYSNGQLASAIVGGVTSSFSYDALGRRTLKEVSTGAYEKYHYDGDRVAYVTNNAGTILQRFTYDGDGKPLYMGMNGTLYFYHYNAHGDVIRLTDLTGQLAAEYEYDAWGSITNQNQLTAVARANPNRYAGYWYDDETKLYYLKARYYRSDLGRFISQDTWKGDLWRPLTQNNYVYGNNNPGNVSDPSGHVPCYMNHTYNSVYSSMGIPGGGCSASESKWKPDGRGPDLNGPASNVNFIGNLVGVYNMITDSFGGTAAFLDVAPPFMHAIEDFKDGHYAEGMVTALGEILIGALGGRVAAGLITAGIVAAPETAGVSLIGASLGATATVLLTNKAQDEWVSSVDRWFRGGMTSE